jgi:hypothetical protein
LDQQFIHFVLPPLFSAHIDGLAETVTDEKRWKKPGIFFGGHNGNPFNEGIEDETSLQGIDNLFLPPEFHRYAEFGENAGNYRNLIDTLEKRCLSDYIRGIGMLTDEFFRHGLIIDLVVGVYKDSDIIIIDRFGNPDIGTETVEIPYGYSVAVLFLKYLPLKTNSGPEVDKTVCFTVDIAFAGVGGAVIGIDFNFFRVLYGNQIHFIQGFLQVGNAFRVPEIAS